MVKKLVALAALVLFASSGLVLFASSGVASAQTPSCYPVCNLTITVTIENAPPPAPHPVVVKAQFFKANSPVTITITAGNTSIGPVEVLANASGVVTFPFTPLTNGKHTASATGVPQDASDNTPATGTATANLVCNKPLGCRVVGKSAGDATIAGITLERPASLAGGERSSSAPQIVLAAAALVGLATLTSRRRTSKVADTTSV